MYNMRFYNEARKLVSRVDSTDPRDYMDYLKIVCMPVDYFTKLKGMYTADKRCYFIFVNTHCSVRLQRTIKFHDIGHHMLHRDSNCVFKEFELYNMANNTELEPNVFSASILMPDDVVYEYAREGRTIGGIAMLTGTDMNLVLIKMLDMQRRGYDSCISDYGKSDFFR